MAQEEDKVVEQTPEEKARLEQLAAHGRVADTTPKSDADKAAEEAAAAEAAKKAEEDAKAAEEAAKAEADKEDDGKWKEEWVTVGNPEADAAIELMKTAGMTPVEGNAVFAEAIKTGDLTKVQWDVLEARIGKAATALVKTGVTAYYDNEYKAQTEIKEFAYNEVGGEAGWTKIQAWAKKQEAADPNFAKELNEWRGALASGNSFSAKAAVQAIKARYEGAPGNSTLQRNMERGQHTPTDTSTGEPMSRMEYYQAMEKAGGDRATQHIKAALQARRALGRSMGM